MALDAARFGISAFSPFMSAMLGVATAWVCYIHRPELPAMAVGRFKQVYTLLINKYGFDDFNERVFAGPYLAPRRPRGGPQGKRVIFIVETTR